MTGSEVASVTAVDLAAEQSLNVDVKLSAAKSAPAADQELPPAIAKALKVMQERMDQLEAELKNRKTQERSEVDSAQVPAQAVDQFPRTLLATLAKSPSAIPIEPGTLARPGERTAVASMRRLGCRPHRLRIPRHKPARGRYPRHQRLSLPPSTSFRTPCKPPSPLPGVDNFTPFAYADFTWLNGTARNKDTVLDTKFFTPEVQIRHSLHHGFQPAQRPHDGRVDRTIPVRRSPDGTDQRRWRFPLAERSRQDSDDDRYVRSHNPAE